MFAFLSLPRAGRKSIRKGIGWEGSPDFIPVNSSMKWRWMSRGAITRSAIEDSHRIICELLFDEVSRLAWRPGRHCSAVGGEPKVINIHLIDVISMAKKML